MFGVIVCPQCNHVKSVNLSSMTTKCIRCGKTLQIKKLKIFYETESQEKLRKAIGLLNAEFQKKNDVFKKVLNDKNKAKRKAFE